MKSFPNAKIKIGHNIIGLREDGYHEIQSVFYPIGLTDEIEVSENKESQDRIVFSFSGFEIACEAEDNLCWFAHYLVSRDYRIPNVKVHLHKNIPIGAGLGGSSSDAAFFIRLLNDEFKLGMAWGEVHHYARQLSSDCSFFASNRPSLAEGRGDQYESILLDLSDYYVAVVYPGITIRTEEAYQHVIPKIPVRTLEEDVVNLPVEQWKEFIENDFEESVFSKYPEIKKIKQQLYEAGASFALMTGRGSSVYGLFKTPPNLKILFPDYFVFESRL